MSRPFLLLYTGSSGADNLARLLETHPFVNIRKQKFDKPEGRGVVPEARRIEVVHKVWSAYERPIRRAVGLMLRIEAQEGHLRPGSALLDAIRGYEPALLVLRDDNWVMQAVERLTEGQEAPVAVDMAQLRASFAAVRQDYAVLDEVAEQLGPVMEIARDEIHDAPDMLMGSVAHLLALPEAEREALEDGPGGLPVLEEMVRDPETVRAFAEETGLAGMD